MASALASRPSSTFAASNCYPASAKQNSRWRVCAVKSSPPKDGASRTQKIMEKVTANRESGGAGGSLSYDALKRLDDLWLKIRSTAISSEIVKRVSSYSSSATEAEEGSKLLDVIVCGGTLGIFVATALCLKGLRVGIVEKQTLQGRVQEWNISRKEVMDLVETGIITEDELQEIIKVSFNPNRCSFNGKTEVWVEDILNLGISPFHLIEILKQRFQRLGGIIFEGHGVANVCLYNNSGIITLDNGDVLEARLILDSMGNFSPIVKQIRSKQKPDGVCLVVGSCGRGFKRNDFSDVIYTNMPIRNVGGAKVQYFWEAFPSGSGQTDRTTYLFAYLDPKQNCPSLEDMLEDYWDSLPNYQGVNIEELEILRVVFGIFPTYFQSPLPAAFDRVLQVGDAGGLQSPVSFGGFGSITRHLSRLSDGIYEAIASDSLDSKSLSLLNPYMPNLSTAWLFQKAMSARQDIDISQDFINELLAVNFSCMNRLGDPVIRPFLQDVIQFGPLAKILGQVILKSPQLLPSIFKQVGLKLILEWTYHFSMLGLYTLLSSYAAPYLRSWVETRSEKERYIWNRRFEAWKYGSGLDYKLESSSR